MRPTSGRLPTRRWLQVGALLCLFVCSLAQAIGVDALAARDIALIDARVAAMSRAEGEMPALYVVGVA